MSKILDNYVVETLNARDPRFVGIAGNRPISIINKGNKPYTKNKKRQVLIDTLEEYGQAHPILCVKSFKTNNYIIADGQHRHQVLAILNYDVKMHVYSIDAENKTSEEIDVAEKRLVEILMKATNCSPVVWDRKQHFNWEIIHNKEKVYELYGRLIGSYPNLDVHFLYNTVSGKRGSFKKDYETKSLIAKDNFSEELLKEINDISGAFLSYRKKTLGLLGAKKDKINYALQTVFENNPSINFDKFRGNLLTERMVKLDVTSAIKLAEGLKEFIK